MPDDENDYEDDETTFTVKITYKGKSIYLDEISYQTTSVELISDTRIAFKLTKKTDILLALKFNKQIIAEEVPVGDDGEIGIYNKRAFKPGSVTRMGAKVSVQATKLSKKTEIPADPNKFRDDNVWGHYEGDLNSDYKRHGTGKIAWEDGNSYDGEWVDDKQHGLGASTHANGSRYEGGFKRGKRDGEGTYLCSNGDKYVGGYKADLRDGFGTYWYKSGEKYVGEYKAGKRHGRGIFYWKDGSVDVGHYKQGKESGECVRWNKDRTLAVRLMNGQEGMELGQGEAREIARGLGFSDAQIDEATKVPVP